MTSVANGVIFARELRRSAAEFLRRQRRRTLQSRLHSAAVARALSLRHLANKDVFSKSDPICIVYNGSVEGYGKKREIGRTETLILVSRSQPKSSR